MRMIIFLLIITMTTGLDAGKEPVDIESSVSHCYVLVVGGLNFDSELQNRTGSAIGDLQRTYCFDANNETIHFHLLADKDQDIIDKTGESTTANIKKTIADLAKKIKPADRFVFYYIGQANVVTGQLRINVRGPDLTGKELADCLSGIISEKQLLIMDCPSAGAVCKSLAGKNKIVVCAARSDQHYTTNFSEYFLLAFSDNDNDCDQDGRVSLLEAFQGASRDIDEYYRSQDLLCTESPIMDDDGNGIPSQYPWRFKIDGHDGELASKWFMLESHEKVNIQDNIAEGK